MLARREIIDLATIEAVSHTNLKFSQTIQDVELGQRQAVDPAGANALAHEHGIEPAAAPRPAGHGAEFAAALPDQAADIVGLLGGEGSFAHPRRIGFADTEHVADRRWPETRARRCLRRDRIGGGHERVGAVVDVEEGPLRTFEQDALALAAPLIE